MSEAKSMSQVWAQRLAPYVRSLSERRLRHVMNHAGTTGTQEHIADKKRRMQAEILYQVKTGQMSPDFLYAAAESL